jgi:plastocyanin
VDNTVLLGRSSLTADTADARDSKSQSGMQPTHLRVPVGTTVSFRNPGVETFPAFPNQLPHCATQFFEGEFDVELDPGETYEHTFDRAGEYFFNDCTDPRPTGKIEVYLTPREVPGALRFLPSRIDLGSGNGIFTGVRGRVTATMRVPAGYRYDGTAALITPLSQSPVEPVKVRSFGSTLVLQFAKADLDNNVPEGQAVPLTLTVNFLHRGVQKQLTSTASPTIRK